MKLKDLKLVQKDYKIHMERLHNSYRLSCGDFCFQNNYGLLSLEIEITSTRNSGRYVCRAVNSQGEAETSARVDIRG